ncbi:MAG: hypothetical protein K9I85_07070 [Saprospiraceae bacterium]|nr:hypothetical protein [Saprospiraceae bacterium]
MNSLTKPFPLLIIINSLIILFLFVAVTDPNFQIVLTGSSSPGSGRTPLMGTIQHVTTTGGQSRTTPYQTYSTGYSDKFFINSNDRLNISSPTYRSLSLNVENVESLNRKTTMGITLYRNISAQPRIEGRISHNGQTNQVYTVICDECPVPTNTVNTDDGIYSLPTGGTINAYTVHYLLGQVEMMKLNIEPETKDDHATIDIAFDDSHGLIARIRSFFTHMPTLLTSE